MCNCSGGSARVGRALRTSGDYVVPPTEPMALFAPGEMPVPPDGAKYAVHDSPAGTAFFSGHRTAFSWQQEQGGGRLRTV